MASVVRIGLSRNAASQRQRYPSYPPRLILSTYTRRSPTRHLAADGSIPRTFFSTVAATGGHNHNSNNNNAAAETAASQRPSSYSSSSDRVVRTVYRQLLRWCDSIPSDLPLTTLVPPVTITSPDHLDAYRLEVLAEPSLLQQDPVVRRVQQLLSPVPTELSRTTLTVALHDASHVRALLQAIFRLNQAHPQQQQQTQQQQSELPSSSSHQEYQKMRQTVAFGTLKSLNELSVGIQSILDDRRHHENRQGVALGIGTVVQHREERWRGVVAKWSRQKQPTAFHNDNNKGTSQTKSSLTLKDYSTAAVVVVGSNTNTKTAKDDNNDNNNDPIMYEVLLDAGDAHSMGSSSGWSRASAADLLPVTDDHLVRIRSNFMDQYFTRWDKTTQLFIPTDLHAYHYPHDPASVVAATLTTTATTATVSAVSSSNDTSTTTTSVDNHRPLDADTVQLCTDIVEGAQQFAEQLERCILDETSSPASRGWRLLQNVQTRVRAVVEGRVMTTPERHRTKKSTTTSTTTTTTSVNVPQQQQQQQQQQHPSPLTWASYHLRELLNIQLEILDVNYQRRLAQEHTSRIQFRVGDVVRHTHYGFRGVVVAWDPYPVMDVRNWDGLQHLDQDPMELPFYHIVPDQGDCVQIFGGERPFRYVCQANLELCPSNERAIEVDLEPGWEREPSTLLYKAPQEVRYKFGADLDDGGATERCMLRIQDEYNSWHLQARGVDESSENTTTRQLSLRNINRLLRLVDNQNDAAPIQETVKEMRKAHPRRDLRWRLDSGVAKLMSGQGEQALEIYKIVVGEDRRYAEAWNKLATCEYMLGKHDESMESTAKVLELDPEHFQALNGLGLLHFEHGQYQQAAECFRKSVDLDPWSPAASKLSMTLDLLNRIIERDEVP